MIMKKVVSILISFVFSVYSFADITLTKELNQPQSGEKISLSQINSAIKFNNTFTIDLSETITENNYKISYSEYKDSILICSQNRETEIFSFSGDSIMLISHRKPGLNLNYIIPEVSAKYPLKKGENISGLFYAEGARAMCDYVRISGKYIISADNNSYTIITPEADTITNLFHTKYIRHGSTFIDADFSHSYKSGNFSALLPDSIMWHLENDSITHFIERHYLYAHGYRYPILETRLHKVLYYGEAIDSSFIALYCSKYSQSHDLIPDPLNEEIRLANAANSFRNNFNDIVTTKSQGSSIKQKSSLMNNDNNSTNNNISDKIDSLSNENEYCDINHTGEINSHLKINYSTISDCIVAIALHNAAGALMWQTSVEALHPHGEILCPTYDLVAGEYLVTVFLKYSQYSFKFIKK